jgi:hypothetical protein
MKETPKTADKPQAAAISQSRAIDPLMTAAYRDGLYVGKLAARRGEQRLAPAARWSAQIDRDAFLAGYQQANAEAEADNEN